MSQSAENMNHMIILNEDLIDLYKCEKELIPLL